MNTSPEFKTALDRFMAVAQSVVDTLYVRGLL